MRPEDVITEDIISGVLKDSIGVNPEVLEIFTTLYICEKLRQDMTAKAVSIMSDSITKELKSVLNGDSLLPEAIELEEELREIKRHSKLMRGDEGG